MPNMSPEQRRLWIRRVLGCESLTAAQKNVLIALETYANYHDGTNAFPGEANLAEMCGLQVRAVNGALARGQELGLIEQTKPANSRAGLAAVYRLLPPLSAVPDEASTTGMAVPVDNSTTGMATHHDRHGQTPRPAWPRRHDRHGHAAHPPSTLQAPSKHQLVVSESGTSPAPWPPAPHTNPVRSRFCDEHPQGTRGKCPHCANARTAFEAWQAAEAERDVALAAANDLDRRRLRNLADACPDCYGSSRVSADEDGTVNIDGDYTVRCTHPNLRMVGNA